jgi:NAD(P)-dependent dehydrogenase (short-subunit alcohol dehydrogenase family)
MTAPLEPNEALMHGKTCLVTGATAGLGAATAEGLARLGASVVIVSRSRERCEAAVDGIRRATGNSSVDFLTADLSSQADVRGVARAFLERYGRLDVLVNNAGGIFLKRERSADGIEMTFALNHLGYFLLTNLLLEVLKRSAPARIVNVSSSGHQNVTTLDFDDLSSPRRYRGVVAYSRSKLANLLFTRELSRRLEGTGVTANAVDPGMVETDIGRNNGWIYWPLKTLFGLIYKARYLTPDEGASTIVYLATSSEVERVTGGYFANSALVEPSGAARDDVAAVRLWALSDKLTGERPSRGGRLS